MTARVKGIGENIGGREGWREGPLATGMHYDFHGPWALLPSWGPPNIINKIIKIYF